MRIETVDYQFGPRARRRLDEARSPSHEGAVAALETFYYALNNRDLDTLAAVWSRNGLAQLNNPVGGIVRSGHAVAAFYRRMFAGSMQLTVTFGDAVTYWWDTTAVFAGREVGQYLDHAGTMLPVTIRTTRVFGYDATEGRWLQLHHHGSIDQPADLTRYQRVASAPGMADGPREFLVDIATTVPEGTLREDADTRYAAEAQRVRELAAGYSLLRLWRTADGRTLGLFRAADESDLDANVLSTLPLRSWMEVAVTPITPHPNDPRHTIC